MIGSTHFPHHEFALAMVEPAENHLLLLLGQLGRHQMEQREKQDLSPQHMGHKGQVMVVV